MLDPRSPSSSVCVLSSERVTAEETTVVVLGAEGQLAALGTAGQLALVQHISICDGAPPLGRYDMCSYVHTPGGSSASLLLGYGVGVRAAIVQ